MGQGGWHHGGGGWHLRDRGVSFLSQELLAPPVSQWMSPGLQETLEPSPALPGPQPGNLSKAMQKQGQTAQAHNQSELFLKVTRKSRVCDVEA
ncbi:unnamed protein product [Rangifer tarandus platyrhynchus]|uniref:Uncharacterized protein n=1 Tax=Rangifer tarandus platyrhynchus TaxID=3082113 RepID=A0AC59YF36_RANTA